MRNHISRAESLEPRRLLSNPAALDRSFGNEGVAVLEAGSDATTAVAPLSDGRVLAVAEHAGAGIALGIFKSDGTLERSRVRDYVATIDIADMVVDAGGKIVVAGTISDPNQNPDLPEGSAPQFLVLRFNADLSPDASFGANGAVQTDFSDLGFAALGRSIAVSPAGKIAVAGLLQLDVNNVPDTRFAIAQYNADGTLDTGFSGDGRQVTDTPGNLQLGGVAVGQVEYQSDGKPVVVGNTRGDFLLVRYNANGTLDKSFSGDGLASSDINHGSEDFANALAIQPDGKIIVAGGTVTDDNSILAIGRYNTNGLPDATFSGGFVSTSGEFLGNQAINRITLGSDGRILAAGAAGQNMLLTQFDSTGALDTTFGQNGFSVASQALGGPGATDVVLQSDGKIIVGMLTGNDQDFRPAVARFGLEDVILTNAADLSISGTSADDVVRISRVSGNVRVIFNGETRTYTSPVHTIHAQLVDGDDTFNSSLGVPTTVDSGTGNDLVLTGDAADLVSSAAGHDTVVSNAGNDTVSTSGGRDVIAGGAGDDVLTGGSEADVINGDAGNDTIVDQGDGSASGGAGNDTLRFSGGPVTASGGDGDDLLFVTSGDNFLMGEAGNDTLTGGSGNDSLSGGDGNDDIRGFDGNDSVIGNAGSDTLYGGVGADLISGNGGSDHLKGDGGADRLFGGEGNDAIDGTAGNDRLFGQGGNDKLFGGEGDDTLDGGGGIDVFIANLGNDAIFSRDENIETLDGGTGEDHGIIDADDVLVSVETDDQLFN